jgi:uncharacterized protein YfbU (UPF0304 family)
MLFARTLVTSVAVACGKAKPSVSGRNITMRQNDERFPNLPQARMPCEIIDAVDVAARENFLTGSQYVREALLKQLREFEQTDPAVAKEVNEILHMWLSIEGTGSALSEEEHLLVIEAVPNFYERSTLIGFSDIEEAEHLRAARFMINPLSRFYCFRDRELKAAGATLDTLHRPMLKTHKRICPGHHRDRHPTHVGMSVEQLIEVLNAPDKSDDV